MKNNKKVFYLVAKKMLLLTSYLNPYLYQRHRSFYVRMLPNCYSKMEVEDTETLVDTFEMTMVPLEVVYQLYLSPKLKWEVEGAEMVNTMAVLP